MTDRQKFLDEISVARSQTWSKMEGVYNEPVKPAVRIGADDHENLPSRRNNKLIYKSGHVDSVKPKG